MTRASPEYNAWLNMRKRCLYKAGKDYKYYGSRGITICDRWSSFKLFLQDMGARPSAQHSLERIKNNLGYSPENCKWATKHEQNVNRKRHSSAKKNDPMRNITSHPFGWRVRMYVDPKKQFTKLCSSLEDALLLRDILEFERAFYSKVFFI